MCDQNPPPKLRNTRVEIPEEILFDEILARLPVKSLSRFKCVSKPWLSLIERDRFIKIHCRNSAKNPRVMMTRLKLRGCVNDGCSLQSSLESKETSYSDTSKNEQKVGVLVGCCNGVVCLYNCRRFSLWNPATRVSVELPRHNDEGCSLVVPVKSGFGWDESTGAHKVFVVLCAHENNNLKMGILYSSNLNSWRKISPGCISWSGRHGLFLRGNLHWVDGRSQIECLDLKREEFGRIELPLVSSNDGMYNPWSWLGVIGGNLSMLIYLKESFEVWVMKEYGLKDSWFKFLTFPSTSLCWPTRGVTSSILFGEGPNGEIFVIYGENLIIYNPKDDAFSPDTTKVRIFEALVYVESLVSPKTILGAATTAR